MAIGHVVTKGFGNGTFSGAIKEVVARGFIVDGAAAPVAISGISAQIQLTAHSATVEGQAVIWAIQPDQPRTWTIQ